MNCKNCGEPDKEFCDDICREEFYDCQAERDFWLVIAVIMLVIGALWYFAIS